MLNTIIKILIFSLALFICGTSVSVSPENKGTEILIQAPAQDKGTIIMGLADALDIANKNFHDTLSDVYESNIKSEYYTWIYNHNRLKVLNEKQALISDYIAIAELHYKSGETDITGKALAETGYFKFESQYTDAGNDVLISENNLRKLLFINSDIKPADDSLGKYYLPADKIEILDNDSIVDDYSDFLLQKDYINLKLLLKKYDDQLTYYGKILALAQRLADAARLRHKNEDIEYFDYIELISGTIDLRLEYLKALNSYNQAALKIEFYINTFSINGEN